MAKRNYNVANNKLQTVIKVIAIWLALLAIAYVITSFALGGVWNPLKWVKRGKSQEKQAQTWGGVIDDVGNEMNAKATYDMPATMAFYATTPTALAEQLNLSAPSVTVTCSHNFEFNNILVDWSIEYPSGASATDVVTVTPTSDGSLTANVRCSAPFDTQLTLKATLRGNPEKTATCTIDYVKRITTFNDIVLNASDFGDDSGISCNPVFGTGTIKGNLRIKEITWLLDSDFENEVQSYLKFAIKFTSHKESNKILNEYYAYDGDLLTYSMFVENFDNYDEAHKNAIYYAWWTAFNNGNYIKNHRSNVVLDVDIELLYNGNVIQNYVESDYLGGLSFNYLSGEVYGIDLSPDLTLNTSVTL